MRKYIPIYLLILLLILPCIFLSATITYCAPLYWCRSRANALSIAQSKNKIVLLIAGRDSCGRTNHMRNICETDIAVHAIIEQHFVPWYCDTDLTKEWYTYAKGISDSFDLPLICCINPSDKIRFLDRTTGVQTSEEFLDRLQTIINNLKKSKKKR